jgi:hypothetical protein
MENGFISGEIGIERFITRFSIFTYKRLTLNPLLGYGQNEDSLLQIA